MKRLITYILLLNAGTGFARLTENSDEIPAPWIYDPVKQSSYQNHGSTRLNEQSAPIEIPFTEQQSFTLELFVKPDLVPQKTTHIVYKTQRSNKAAAAGLGIRRLRQWKQSYYSGFLTQPGGKPQTWSTGHYVTISRLRGPNPGKKDPGNLTWRHVALVYDHAAKTITTYLDRWQVVRQQLDGPLTWDDGPLYVGGLPGSSAFSGWIDEVRLTPDVLDPAEFLKEVEQPLKQISFTSPATILPKDMVIDLKACFGAVGDGQHDDTRAFQKAFTALANKVPGGWYNLYVPPGTYLISDTIRHKRFFVVQGAGREKTVIKLKDGAAGFQDPEKPKAVYGCGYSPWGGWGRGAGNHIGVYLFDFTINTGKGNPAAVALDHHSNNRGTVERVALRSGDGSGLIGLSFVRPWPGPALIKDVSIDGFDVGIKMRSQEYSMTMEHITLRNQNVAGIENRGNIMALRKITSHNRVPAIVGHGGNNMIALFDSEFRGGAEDHYAIESGGSLYVRNLKTEGYRGAIEKRQLIDWKKKEWGKTITTGPEVDEFVGDRVVSSFGQP
ncbi:MAG: glycosyl hydrolase family 28-related protein, partial [Verrucomicrobiota bacterium]